MIAFFGTIKLPITKSIIPLNIVSGVCFKVVSLWLLEEIKSYARLDIKLR